MSRCEKFFMAQGRFTELRKALHEQLPGIEFQCHYQAFDEDMLIERWDILIQGSAPYPLLVEHFSEQRGGLFFVYQIASRQNSVQAEIDALTKYIDAEPK